MSDASRLDCSERLFSYGTLQLESVQLKTFGRKLAGIADALTGYRLTEIEITDPDVIAASGKNVHPMLCRTGNTEDCVHGTVFAITPRELLNADEYEVDDYRRVLADCVSGGKAWVYIDASE